MRFGGHDRDPNTLLFCATLKGERMKNPNHPLYADAGASLEWVADQVEELHHQVQNYSKAYLTCLAKNVL